MVEPLTFNCRVFAAKLLGVRKFVNFLNTVDLEMFLIFANIHEFVAS